MATLRRRLASDEVDRRSRPRSATGAAAPAANVAFATADGAPIRRRRLGILAAFGARSLESDDPAALMREAAVLAAEGMKSSFAMALEHRPATDDLLVRAGVGWRDGVVGQAVARTDTMSPEGYLFRTGVPIAIEDLRDQQRFERAEPLQSHGIVSLLGVPIRCGGDTYGVLEIATEAPRRFDQDEIDFLAALASFVAAAIRRRRIEERREASERQTVEILESIGAAFYALDEAWRFTYVNHRAEELLGVRRDDLLGRIIWDALEPAVGDELHAAHLRAAVERRPVALDLFLHALGRWIGVTVYPNAAGLSVYFRDITERKRMMEALRRSERELQRAQTMARLGHWTWVPQGKASWDGGLSEYSCTSAAIFGTSASGLRIANAEYRQRFVHPDDREGVASNFRRFAEGDDSSTAREYRIIRADGAVRWVRELMEKILNTDGTLLHISGTIQDITEQKEAEFALRERDERLRAALLASSTGTYRWDVRTNALEGDEGLARLYGLAPGESVSTVSDDLQHIHPEDRAAVAAASERCARDGVDFEMDYRIIRTDGTMIWIAEKGKLFRDRDGTPLYMTGACMDITARKQAERYQQLLTAELSHRVKNTLAVVQSVASQTMRRCATMAEFAQSFGGRLQALATTHSLLTRNRWQSAELAVIVRQSLRGYATRQTLTIQGPEVALSPKQTLSLGLMLHELATNAAKYGALSTDHGRIEIGWSVDLRDDGTWLRLVWTERGGPPVMPLRTEGFGTSLIQRAVAYELQGTADLAYDPDGLRCTIIIPWSAEPQPAPDVADIDSWA